MTNIITIWWWNWHSNLLDWIMNTFINKVNLKAIVSMSDDWRTTWRLMRYFEEDLLVHFPPPWDLRRCLYFLSSSKYKCDFKNYFEIIIQDDIKISSLNLWEISKLVWAYDFLNQLNFPYFNFKLPINHSLEWHKFWNIFMWFIFFNLEKNYDKMMDFMHTFLEVKARVIPVTTDRAYIKANLLDWNTVEKQDNISNLCNYNSRIIELELMDCSKKARHNSSLDKTISEADYIIISPWDLYTSTISNLIIWDVKSLIKTSNAKIIFIANNTNKWWETSNYTIYDFIEEIEKYLWKSINYIIANNKKLELNEVDEKRLKNDISVKWWDYIYITDKERKKIREKNIFIIEDDLLDRKTLYKHNNIKLATILEKIIFNWL